MRDVVLRLTDAGLYCAAGDFYIDPWRAVPRAIITHAHSDHARAGSRRYLAAPTSQALLRHRLGPQAAVEALPYGQRLRLGEAEVSLHPAGHILGSAQVRVEVDGEVWVVSGDYKREADPSCEGFEVVPCDVFVTEATFATPVYCWPSPEQVVEEIYAWWRANHDRGVTSVLGCYALGKAQRVLASLRALTDDLVLTHGAVEALTALYRVEGVDMVPTLPVTEAGAEELAGALVLAPPSAFESPWMKRLGRYETAFASGWMRVRGVRRRRGVDRGFVLSDHADWRGLLRTIDQSGAGCVLATHGASEALVRYLREERGLRADALKTAFEGEAET